MPENTYSLEKTVMALWEKKRISSLRDLLLTLQPVQVAGLFEVLPEEARPLLFRLLPKETAAEVFVELDAELQATLIRGLTDVELKAIVEEISMDDAADIVEEMPANVVHRILEQASPEARRTINELLKYPEDSAGSIMTTEFVSLHATDTVAEAIALIRRTGNDQETVDLTYVVDEGRKLIGVASLRAILRASDEDTMDKVMQTHVVSVNTLDDKEAAAHALKEYDFNALPVVDNENRLVGIVTVDDALDVLEDEATEDIAKMAAITPGDRPYLRTPILTIFKNRIPWLLLLMVSATFTGIIITKFEDALSVCVALTSFIPMLMDTSGNAGSQSSVTIIRGISLGEIEFSDIGRVVWREARVSILCGIALAACAFLKAMFFDRVGAAVALVVSLTLVVTVVAAKLVGCTLPMLAKKIGFDPAVMASPFITTIVDALALLVYFSFATQILGI